MTPIKLEAACRLTITVEGGTTFKHRPLYSEIVRRAKDHGLANTVVLHAVEGFGPNGVIHTARSLSMVDRLPLLIMAVDDEAKIQGFLPEVAALTGVESLLIDQVQRLVPR